MDKMKNFIAWAISTVIIFIGLAATSYYFRHDLSKSWTIIALLVSQIISVPALLSWVKTFKEILK